ncbi:MAG: alkaline phosphatase D family protein [Verrucomicrobiota bacterium]
MRVGLLLLLFGVVCWADEEESRRWVGGEHFAIPLHDWRVEEGDVWVEPGSFGTWAKSGSRLYKSTQSVGSEGEFTMRLRLELVEESKFEGKELVGVYLGMKSRTPSPRNVWVHPTAERFFVGLNGKRQLVVGDEVLERVWEFTEKLNLDVFGSFGEEADQIMVSAAQQEGGELIVKQELPKGTLSGIVSLIAKGKGNVWKFERWSLDGTALLENEEHAVGPILWTQYTLQDSGLLKLQAQMVPLEERDAQVAELEFEKNGEWELAGKAELEPLSSTFLFRVEGVKAEEAMRYRVKYVLEDEVFFWEGEVRVNPKDQHQFVMGVSNCDHGELFPQDTMVGNIKVQDPDLMFFAGDQVYEDMDEVGIVREPLEGARLSYLGKWYQFGLTWRELLKDRPSVIIPDDHDVFMGNIWGDNGLGYIMQPDWVNMVQRTQTGSLPDPVDPEPVERGIGVYFTALDYAGMSFAVIEDRKFKSPQEIVKLPFKEFVKDRKLMDVEGAKLLGERQLKFLEEWTKRTEEMPARFFLSQTMFAKAQTHTGPKLKRLRASLDSNGWPQSARNRALKTVGRDTIMVHGDQHLGVLARMGIEEWDDGPLAFMLTGASVGWPRAWWPNQKRHGEEINGPYTGRYFDDHGNRITMHGVTNPERLPEGVEDAFNRPDLEGEGIFAIQHAKGSGHGLVAVDKKKGEVTFHAFRLDIDAKQPEEGDEFRGFPVTLEYRN